MGTIVEAPIMTEDRGAGEMISPNFPDEGRGVNFSPATLATEGVFPGDSQEDTGGIHGLRSSYFPLPHDPGLGAAAPEVNAATAQGACRTTEPRVPPTPGAALLEEFDPLYHKYQRRVYRQCYRMLGNPEDAEDLTQEVFLQLFRKAHTFRGDANFSTWLYRLTVNTVLMQLRRRRRWRAAVTSLDAAPGVRAEVSDVLTVVSALPEPTADALDRVSLEVAVAQLSSGYREIFILHDVEGYRHDEIAKLLGISEGTSKSQLHKARLRLRALIGSSDHGSVSFRCARAARNPRRKRCPSSRAVECGRA